MSVVAVAQRAERDPYAREVASWREAKARRAAAREAQARVSVAAGDRSRWQVAV